MSERHCGFGRIVAEQRLTVSLTANADVGAVVAVDDILLHPLWPALVASGGVSGNHLVARLPAVAVAAAVAVTSVVESADAGVLVALLPVAVLDVDHGARIGWTENLLSNGSTVET